MRNAFLIVAATAVVAVCCSTSGEPPQIAGRNNTSEPVSAPLRVPSKKITLLGITTLSGKKRALLKTEALNKSRETQHLILSEHQKVGEVEILEIDEVSGSVRVNVSGVVKLLTFERDLLSVTDRGSLWLL